MKIVDFTGLFDYRDSLLQAFLDQEALMLYSRECEVMLLHAWRHVRGFLAGSRDASLGGWNQTVSALRKKGYYVLVRPFGGLAIPVDFGVLNLTLVIPDEPTLDSAFDQLASWIAGSLSDYGKLRIGEVDGSYCPGRYDLSLNGMKIAGLAQRRAKGVVAVSAFINLYPEDVERSLLVRNIYLEELVAKSSQVSWIPHIEPAAVSDLYSITHDQKWYDPNHLFSLLAGTKPLRRTNTSLKNMIAPHYDQAVHRLKTLRHLEEWIPLQ